MYGLVPRLPLPVVERPRSATGAAAIVLAGGRSSRMGTPKALLLFDDQPLIVHVVAALRGLFDEIVVVAAPGQDLPSMPVTLVRDEVAHQGPVGGIYYGLSVAGADVSFVTSCDSAFLNLDLISHLVAQIPEHDVVVPLLAGPLSAAARGLSAQRGAVSRGAARARRAEARLPVRSRSNPQDRRRGDSPLRPRRVELLQHEHTGRLRGGAAAPICGPRVLSPDEGAVSPGRASGLSGRPPRPSGAGDRPDAGRAGRGARRPRPPRRQLRLDASRRESRAA